jgi:hypothetical protein
MSSAIAKSRALPLSCEQKTGKFFKKVLTNEGEAYKITGQLAEANVFLTRIS